MKAYLCSNLHGLAEEKGIKESQIKLVLLVRSHELSSFVNHEVESGHGTLAPFSLQHCTVALLLKVLRKA